jgi:hypothetical protein
MKERQAIGGRPKCVAGNPKSTDILNRPPQCALTLDVDELFAVGPLEPHSHVRRVWEIDPDEVEGRAAGDGRLPRVQVLEHVAGAHLE